LEKSAEVIEGIEDDGKTSRKKSGEEVQKERDGDLRASGLGPDREWKPGNMRKDSILLYHVSIP
jgi:hypothetical protein